MSDFNFDPFEMAGISCDLIERRMLFKYGSEPILKVTTPKYPIIAPPNLFIGGFWVAVVQLWGSEPVSVPLLEIHSTGEAFFHGSGKYNLLNLRERTIFLSTIEGISN